MSTQAVLEVTKEKALKTKETVFETCAEAAPKLFKRVFDVNDAKYGSDITRL
jgi:hypothetical protein